MWSMLLQDAERQNARALRTFDSVDEVCAGKFFPVHRQFGLRRAGLRWRGLCGAQDCAKKQETKYVSPHFEDFLSADSSMKTKMSSGALPFKCRINCPGQG